MLKSIGLAGLAILITCGLALPSTSVAAQEQCDVPAKQHRFTAGVGFWSTRSPLEGSPHDPRSGVFPWLSYESQRLTVDPSGVAVRLFSCSHFKVEGLLAPRWQLADTDDSVLHDDLRRRTGLDLGTRISAVVGPTVVSVSYRADVSGRIDGHEITAEAAYGLPLPGDGELALRGGAYWRDSTLNTYLYGVLPGEEREDRPAYRVGNGITPFAGAMVSYPVKGNLRANVTVEAQFLSSEAADSPIIARNVVPSALFGLFYVF